MKINPINNINFKAKINKKHKSSNHSKNHDNHSHNKKIIFKNGTAYDLNGKKYTGRIIVKDKNGKPDMTLYYDKGLIIRSEKGDMVYKMYRRFDLGGNSEHIFSDGSKLTDDEFYNNIPTETTVIVQGENISEITQNKNAKYANEPILYLRRYKIGNPDKYKEFKILKSDGEEKFEFKNLDEAKKFFMEEYGIEADFDNLAQAHIVKNAVDDFVKLNFNNEGKELFKGIKIFSNDYPDKTTPAYILPSHFISWYNQDTYNKYSLIEDDDEKIKYIIQSKPDIIELMDVSLVLNSNYNWQDSGITSKLRIKNSLSGSSLKHLIVHELAHVLHSSYCPYEYLIYSLHDTNKKALIRSKVSKYLADSGTEFVAEYIAGRLAGKKYSPVVDKLYANYSSINPF